MKLQLKSSRKPTGEKSQCLIFPLSLDLKSTHAEDLDQACNGLIKSLIKRGDLNAKAGSRLFIPSIDGIAADSICLISMGNKADEARADALVQAMSAATESLNKSNISMLLAPLENLSEHWTDTLCHLSKTLTLSQYRYQRTLSKPRPKSAVKKVTLLGSAGKAQQQAVNQGQAIGHGMNVARELGNLPANICTPSYLVKEARALARSNAKIKCTVLDEKKMRELGMGSLLSVTAGTNEPAKLIALEYRGAAKASEKPQVLVGKGITFDSGGISLKPGAKMDEMKYDMCGAASVLGTMHTIAELEPNANIVGVIVAAENLPSGTATKPGDVVTSMSGQTIEILNTDAEGRLVLCDALTWVKRFKPAAVIDIATLTGACVVALGRHASAVYANQQALADALLEAGTKARDKAWQMPLWDEYQNQLDSNFADMANIGGPEAGSVTAACFLSRFTEDYPWAHMDIAGTAWLSGGNKGGTGRPVALLSRYLLDNAANKAANKAS